MSSVNKSDGVTFSSVGHAALVTPPIKQLGDFKRLLGSQA